MNRHIVIFFISLGFMIIGFTLTAHTQPSTDLNEFKINVQGTPDGIKMQSFKGSAWTDLSFTITIDKPVAIDEYGMTELDNVSQTTDPKYADFLFTIAKTENEIILKGIKGVEWKELRFNLNSHGYTNQSIDRFGLIK